MKIINKQKIPIHIVTTVAVQWIHDLFAFGEIFLRRTIIKNVLLICIDKAWGTICPIADRSTNEWYLSEVGVIGKGMEWFTWKGGEGWKVWEQIETKIEEVRKDESIWSQTQGSLWEWTDPSVGNAALFLSFGVALNIEVKILHMFCPGSITDSRHLSSWHQHTIYKLNSYSGIIFTKPLIFSPKWRGC